MDAAARHFAQWQVLTRGAITDIDDDAFIDRFSRHRLSVPGVPS